MSRSRWALAVTALIFTFACGRGERSNTAADSATAHPAAADSAAAASSGPARVEGFQAPESAKYDAELDVWYVSNINGTPVAKDGNGYISRLKGDGTVDSLKCDRRRGQRREARRAQGLALQGDTLWVADIDPRARLQPPHRRARRQHRRQGRQVPERHRRRPRRTLRDRHRRRGTREGRSSTPAPTGSSASPPDQAVSIAIEIRQPGRPERHHLGRRAGAVHRRAVRRQGHPGVVARGQDHRAAGPDQGPARRGRAARRRTACSSPAGPTRASSCSQNGTVTPVASGLPSPADIGIDTKRNRVAIPLLHREPRRVPRPAGPRQGPALRHAMTDLPRRVRGAATYAAVFGIALALGAGGAWLARGRDRGLIAKDAVTTHGEWVKIPRGSELDPRLRRLSRAEDQGAGGDRDPRDLRAHRLGAHRGRPARQGGLRGDRARPALLASTAGARPTPTRAGS